MCQSFTPRAKSFPLSYSIFLCKTGRGYSRLFCNQLFNDFFWWSQGPRPLFGFVGYYWALLEGSFGKVTHRCLGPVLLRPPWIFVQGTQCTPMNCDPWSCAGHSMRTTFLVFLLLWFFCQSLSSSPNVSRFLSLWFPNNITFYFYFKYFQYDLGKMKIKQVFLNQKSSPYAIFLYYFARILSIMRLIS